MDRLHQLWGQIKHIVVVVASPAEPYPCHLFDFVDVFEKDDKFSDKIIYPRGCLARTHYICPYSGRIKVLGWARACSHELLLGLNTLACSKAAILNDKLSRFYQWLRGQKRLVLASFDLVCDKGTRISFRVVDLQIDDQIVDLLKGTNNLGHHFEFLEKPVFFFNIDEL